MHIYYLEIVTTDVDTLCHVHETVSGVNFGEPDPTLGNARLADMVGGGRMGIRAPMHETEEAVTRPYFKVEDVEAAVKEAEAKGAEIIHAPLDIPGFGTFAICLTGDIQFGLVQV